LPTEHHLSEYRDFPSGLRSRGHRFDCPFICDDHGAYKGEIIVAGRASSGDTIHPLLELSGIWTFYTL
jgi:hypothetical protein